MAEAGSPSTAGPPGSAPPPPEPDQVDRLLLEESADDVRAAGCERVVVIDDHTAAITLAVAGACPPTAPVRVHQDLLTDRARLGRYATAPNNSPAYRHLGLDAELLTGATVVLLRLPRSLMALREIAQTVARHGDPSVVLYTGGRVKHMSRGMNAVLSESFSNVRASLGRGKSRLLIATEPRKQLPPTAEPFPRSAYLDDVELTVCAHGAAFGGAKLDLGTRFLIECLTAQGPPAADPQVRHIVDLGCGTGILAAWAARRWPDATVTATDRSEAAVLSAAATAAANGVDGRVRVLLDEAAAAIPTASADLVLCNPPFHDGTEIGPQTAHDMFTAAGRILRSGGQLWCVWNSHLRYRPSLTRLVGPTRQAGRNPKFTVTVSDNKTVSDSRSGAGDTSRD